MNIQQKTVAERCLAASYNNSMSFPEGVHALMEAGFEGYHVDYRLNARTYYLPNGETVVLKNPHEHSAVAAAFNAPEIAAAIKWAQSNTPDYHYSNFNNRVTDNGCAGYMVSFTGRRVLYYGRTGETYVEHFPR